MMSLKSRKITSFPKATELINKKSGPRHILTPYKTYCTKLQLHFNIKYFTVEYGEKILLQLQK